MYYIILYCIISKFLFMISTLNLINSIELSVSTFPGSSALFELV